MPEIFRRSLATVNSDEELQVSNVWDWSRWVPDALFINLGTNDGDAVTDPDYDYVGVYTDLVLRARQHQTFNLATKAAAMKCARLSTSRRRQRPRGGAACGVWAVGSGTEVAQRVGQRVVKLWRSSGAEQVRRGVLRAVRRGVRRVLVQTPTQCGL